MRSRGHVQRRMLAGAACSLLMLIGVPALGTTATRAGCSTRVAVAYDSTGAPRVAQPAGHAPLACAVPTGFATIETRVAVTSDGSVVQEPATITPGLAGTAYLPGAPGPQPQQPTSPAGIAVSRDAGATWSFVKPAGALYAQNDATLYADPSTGRVFEATLAPGGVPTGGDLAPQEQSVTGYEFLLASPDDGASWYHTALPGFVFSENPRFTSAPPAPGQATTAGGYTDVTYWCGNRDVGLTAPLIVERECFRSLDGGVTWEQRSILLTNPVPQHPECGTNREDISSGDGNYPEGAADGSLYLMVSCGGNVYLARSTDEAASFPIVHTATGPLKLPVAAGSGAFDWPELRVARVGGVDELFLATLVSGAGGPTVQLRTSADGGLTWSAPLTLTPRGLASIERWSLAVQGSEVAVSYIAPSRTVPGGYDGYISVTRDALATSPVVWAATINDPATPLSMSAPQDAKDDFIGIAIGPDGSPWASFPSPCSTEPADQAANDPACAGADGVAVQGGNERAIVGSLLWTHA